MELKIPNQEHLLLLLKVPKKKYLKKLIELGVALNIHHNLAMEGFENQVTQNFHHDLELTKPEAHSLLVALSNLVQSACKADFKFQQHQILSDSFNEQLKDILYQTLHSMKTQIQTAREQSVHEGRKFFQVNWRLDLQIANQSGKSKVPQIILELDSTKSGQLRSDKIKMKGEQFQAFFSNLQKIKNQLSQIVNSSS